MFKVKAFGGIRIAEMFLSGYTLIKIARVNNALTMQPPIAFYFCVICF